MSHSADRDDVERLADTVTWKVLKDLSDRAGVPEWLGSERDGAAASVHRELSRYVVLPALKEADERARIVAWCRTCAANNGLLGGTSALREVKSLTDRDARMFAFIADAVERGDHLTPIRKDATDE